MNEPAKGGPFPFTDEQARSVKNAIEQIRGYPPRWRDRPSCPGWWATLPRKSPPLVGVYQYWTQEDVDRVAGLEMEPHFGPIPMNEEP